MSDLELDDVLSGFDATEHNTDQRSTLPNGIYVLEATEADIAPTKAQNGHVLSLALEVLEPTSHKGRKMFLRINVANASPKAQQIGQEELAKLSRAIGIQKPSKKAELLFQRFTAKVGLEKEDPSSQYGPNNRIKTYYYPDQGDAPPAKIDDVQPPTAANDNRRPAANDNAPAKPAARPAAAAGGKTPWTK